MIARQQALYRMPVNFGPSLGPRQGPGGRRFTGELSRTTLLSVPYLTDGSRLARLLPPGFESGEEPVVTVRIHYNRDLAWLAGRSYNYVEVLFRAAFVGQDGRTEGDFVAVMWEGLADAIIVGREEIGHPKLFADVPDPVVTDRGTRGLASWCGFVFAEVDIEGLQLGPWPAELEDTARPAEAHEGLMTRPRLNYKYIPNAVHLDQPDAEYVVMIPAGTYPQRILETWRGGGRVRFNRARWEDLPTFAQIVNHLAELPVLEWRQASMTRVLRSFNDLRDVARILR
jgi:Acetoacetate decarboxylase (ADC)